MSRTEATAAPEAAGEGATTEDVAVVRRRLRRATAWCWVWTFAAFTVWSLATPLWTEPRTRRPTT